MSSVMKNQSQFASRGTLEAKEPRNASRRLEGKQDDVLLMWRDPVDGIDDDAPRRDDG